jgi:ubiquinone/menaquinone biosynthesis C-methylase UbiE
MKNRIQKMYSKLNALWYDPFKVLWNFIIARQAEKQLAHFLKQNIDEDKSILELGCGTALNLYKIFKLKVKFKSYLGMDFTYSMLQIAKNKFKNKQNVEFRLGDVTNLENLDKKFDILICTWVISHLENPVEFVNNSQKHLNPGGKFFLVFYTRPKWYLNFWFKPIAKHLFYAESFDHSIVKKFKNVKFHKSYSSDLVTVVEISLPIGHTRHQSHDLK